MEYKNIIVENHSGVLVVKFNRPQALNALNSEFLSELGHLFTKDEVLNQVKVIILTGEGKAFIAGADIAEMKDFTLEEARSFAQTGMDVFRKIELIEKPVIAAINGFALGGGCELAMSCDIRIAGEKAKMGQPEVGLGITPGFGGTQRMARLVGIAKAKELIFTGKIINAAESEKIGLVNEVVSQEALLERALALAEEISKQSQTAVRYSKTAINRGKETDIETGLLIEKDIFGMCFAMQDQKEGMEAFLQKRKPNF
jgi:enoyl-CoA hydratase